MSNMVIVQIATVILLIFGIPYLFTLIASPFYFKFGWFKKFFHDLLGWHMPDDDGSFYFDGCSLHDKCKHCGKEIMQDSQGNWF